jgi:mannose-6-phosphate isomerase-like protein (cupin superfamily)
MPDPKLPDPRTLLVTAADRAKLEEESARHPLNPRSEVHGHMLAARTGLRRTGVNWFRVPPGKESTIFHLHWNEEEWAYVLSGRGIAEIGDQELEIGPGDFLGFPPGTHTTSGTPGPRISSTSPAARRRRSRSATSRGMGSARSGCRRARSYTRSTGSRSRRRGSR